MHARIGTSQLTVVRRIALFFFLSYVLTWFGIVGNALWESALWPRPMFALGPIIAAPITIAATTGRAGLRDWVRRLRHIRAPRRTYLFAVVGPALIIVLAAGLAVLTGADIDTANWVDLPGLVLLAPVLAIFGPLPEEPAFRGYAQQEMQTSFSPLTAGLWIGLGVLVWHLPVLLGGHVPWTIALALLR